MIYKAENERMSKLAKNAEAEHVLVQRLKQAWQEEKKKLESVSNALQADVVSLTARLEAAQSSERNILQEKMKADSELETLRTEKERLEEEVASRTGMSTATGSTETELEKAEEKIQELLSQRELMVQELSQRKMLLENAMQEAEQAILGAEHAVTQKDLEISKLV